MFFSLCVNHENYKYSRACREAGWGYVCQRPGTQWESRAQGKIWKSLSISKMFSLKAKCTVCAKTWREYKALTKDKPLVPGVFEVPICFGEKTTALWSRPVHARPAGRQKGRERESNVWITQVLIPDSISSHKYITSYKPLWCWLQEISNSSGYLAFSRGWSEEWHCYLSEGLAHFRAIFLKKLVRERTQKHVWSSSSEMKADEETWIVKFSSHLCRNSLSGKDWRGLGFQMINFLGLHRRAHMLFGRKVEIYLFFLLWYKMEIIATQIGPFGPNFSGKIDHQLKEINSQSSESILVIKIEIWGLECMESRTRSTTKMS